MLLNADIGEGLETDIQLFPYLDQASIACGGHVGNPQSMQQAVQACIANNVVIGAHPSYPDPLDFGRRSIEISNSDLADSLHQQIQSLIDVCNSLGTKLSYIKPHGALYNDIMQKPHLFGLALELVLDKNQKLDLMLGAALSDDCHKKAKQVGVQIIREAFADRQYLVNGQLAPRTQPGAVFNDVDKICSQVADLTTGIARDLSGNPIQLKAESICIHGDNTASVKSVLLIAQTLKS